MSDSEQKLLASAIKRMEILKKKTCFDPYDLDSRPIPVQEAVFEDIEGMICRYVVAANQTGKTSLGAREITWLFQDEHPFIDCKKQWGDRPLTLMVLGRTTKMLQLEIWERKIKPFLPQGTYKVNIAGNVIQSVTHRVNGNQIVFISHNNVNEARQNSQGYVAQYVWLDEMPDSLSLFSELITRIIATRGRFLATFTPLIRNFEIKNLVESVSAPVGKKYKFKMLDNPVYIGREEEILAQYAALPESERNARLYGDWFLGEKSVFNFSLEDNVEAPKDYSRSWRHVETIDPAASGKAGLGIFAEDPSTGMWYLIRDDYIQGDSATKLLSILRPIVDVHNIVRRISDPHEAWFIKEAATQKRHYRGIFKKTERKKELIKNLQEALNSGKLKIAPWCTRAIEEFTTCQWSETTRDKIIGAQRFHLLDVMQYFVDECPKPESILANTTWEAQLRIDNKKRLENKAKKEIKKAGGNFKRSRIWRGRRNGQ